MRQKGATSPPPWHCSASAQLRQAGTGSGAGPVGDTCARARVCKPTSAPERDTRHQTTTTHRPPRRNLGLDRRVPGVALGRLGRLGDVVARAGKEALPGLASKVLVDAVEQSSASMTVVFPI